ncbi:MAG: hypothetical protein IPK24_22095 [Kineosporiaceae bacterium]|nr:hypothetical protein [Kineosporiaceae bacterium]
MTDSIELRDRLAVIDFPDEFDRDWLFAEVFTPLGIEADQHLVDLCEDILLGYTAQAPGELHMRPGGWRINVGASLVRTTVAAAIVGAGLIGIGADQVPLQLLPAVLPLLVDMDRVRLNRGDRQLFVPLRQASAGIEGVAVNPQVLYNRLDPAVRAQLNYGDFTAFLDRLIEAGELDNAGGDDVRPRQPGKPAWLRITWE